MTEEQLSTCAAFATFNDANWKLNEFIAEQIAHISEVVGRGMHDSVRALCLSQNGALDRQVVEFLADSTIVFVGRR